MLQKNDELIKKTFGTVKKKKSLTTENINQKHFWNKRAIRSNTETSEHQKPLYSSVLEINSNTNLRQKFSKQYLVKTIAATYKQYWYEHPLQLKYK